MTAIRVLIVDDQSLIRVGIQTLLSRKPDIQVVGQAADGEEALRQVAALDPDIVLMDIRMPGMDGVEATRQLVARNTRAGIIILTTFQDDANVFSALAAGARGYLLKDTDHKQLAEAIRAVAAGRALIPPDITAQVLREFSRLAAPQPAPRPALNDERLALLTDRELAILRMLGGGRTNQEISTRLAISVGTVKNHISAILSKLDMRDRTQAGLFAQQAGLAE
ncbi:MAG TPA: response regulator transcription factor [Roseiflexaceae bacterium]|nr:response regulator transcription factor [Roseiflexaceae bacterium]